jgi:hypothetical protein
MLRRGGQTKLSTVIVCQKLELNRPQKSDEKSEVMMAKRSNDKASQQKNRNF